jgi:hypothetical protein
MPSALETIAAMRLCFVALDVAPLAGDASCSYLLSARTMVPLFAGLRRRRMCLNLPDAAHFPGPRLS